MKIYTHDYTLPAQARNALFFALENLRNDHVFDAKRDIMQAMELLDKYLASDNLVEDADAEGFIKRIDFRNFLDLQGIEENQAI